MVTWAEEAQNTQQKPMRMKNWNVLGMPKEMKQLEDAQKKNGPKELESDEMGQGSPKQHEYKPNDSTRLLELSRRKAYNRPKRGPTSTSQIITWLEQRGGMARVLINPQRG